MRTKHFNNVYRSRALEQLSNRIWGWRLLEKQKELGLSHLGKLSTVITLLEQMFTSAFYFPIDFIVQKYNPYWVLMGKSNAVLKKNYPDDSTPQLLSGTSLKKRYLFPLFLLKFSFCMWQMPLILHITCSEHI